VLEVIVWRANLQTTGTIYNKETHLLVYANDTDIVGRSHQSAVRNAYLALDREAAKVGLKINEQNIPSEKLDDKICSTIYRWYCVAKKIVLLLVRFILKKSKLSDEINFQSSWCTKNYFAWLEKILFFCDKLWFFIVITIFQSHIHTNMKYQKISLEFHAQNFSISNQTEVIKQYSWLTSQQPIFC
jgi:hypothetical protein